MLMMLCFGSLEALAFDEGFNLGGLQVKPSFELTGKDDSNITYAETNPIHSFITIAKPKVEIVAGREIEYLNLNYEFERAVYRDSKDDSYSDHQFNFGLHREYTHRAVLDAAISYKKSHDSRGTTFTGITTGFTTPDLWNENAANMKFSYGGKQAAGRIVLEGGFALRRYLNHRTLTLGRDLNTSEFSATFYYRLGSKTSALFELKDKMLNYKWAQSPLDSNELTFYTGFIWHPSSITMATIKGGWQRKRFKLSLFPPSQYFSWEAAVEWSPLTYSVWKLNTAHVARESDGSGGTFIKSRNFALSWKHHWLKRLSHLAEFQYQKDVFVGSTRRDKFITAGIGINYIYQPGIEFLAVYGHSNRSSNTFNASYRQNLAKVSFERKF